MTRKMNILALLALWSALTAFAWLGPAKDISDAERRPLAQFPELSGETLLNGRFMTDFEKYTLDQFPLRDTFRSVKSRFHTEVLNQRDNNGIYLHSGHAAQQEYPLDESSLDHAIARFTRLYETYLSGCTIHMAIVPDKGYYLAEAAGQLSLDYDALFARFAEDLPWAAQIDLTQHLSLDDYYYSDTHWRQERLLGAASAICNALGVTAPEAEDFTVTEVDRPFYGVYHGQSALPLDPEPLYLLENELLRHCTVYDYESGTTLGIYDWDKATGRDLYELYLSGPKSLLTIENPAGDPGKELLIFRDSFGSAIAPLLNADYSKVTLIDIRYIQMDVLERFVTFGAQDVLFLYSTLVLNNSETIK